MGYFKEEWEGNEWMGCQCDNCGERWEHRHEGWTLMPDKIALWECLDDHGWYDAGKDGMLCDECWEYNEQDEMIIKNKRHGQRI